MRIGILSDLHLGYSHGNRVHPDGTNVREQDIYDAAYRGVRNLLDAGVDAICDLGDIAHVPHPKKRAIVNLISLINGAEVDWFSCGGNHTAQRTSSDLHLYDLLVDQCPRFHGAFDGPKYFEQIGAYLIPYDTAGNLGRALEDTPDEAIFVGGHWTFDDADWPGEHVPSVWGVRKPTLLGHWHKRSGSWENQKHIYVGATERFAWGEAYNPCGVAIFDTDTRRLDFIDHPVREWLDVTVTPDDYLEDFHYETVENCIVRVNVVATPPQYHSLQLLRIKQKVESSLEYQVRRIGPASTTDEESQRTSSLSIIDGFRDRVAKLKLPKGVTREEVERIGLDALDATAKV